MLPNEELDKILNRVHQWTWQVDQKVSIFLTAQAAVLAWLIEPTAKWFAMPGAWPKLTVIASGLLQGAAIWNSCRALFPHTESASSKSVTFFGHIGAMKLAEYRKALEATDDAAYRDDFISQIHVCSVIASTKFERFKLALILSGIGLGVLALSYWLYVAMVMRGF